jgi:TolA-binding protein
MFVEAYKQMPQNPRALTLVGLVLACEDDQKKKARKVLTQVRNVENMLCKR